MTLCCFSYFAVNDDDSKIHWSILVDFDGVNATQTPDDIYLNLNIDFHFGSSLSSPAIGR